MLKRSKTTHLVSCRFRSSKICKNCRSREMPISNLFMWVPAAESKSRICWTQVYRTSLARESKELRPTDKELSEAHLLKEPTHHRNLARTKQWGVKLLDLYQVIPEGDLLKTKIQSRFKRTPIINTQRPLPSLNRNPKVFSRLRAAIVWIGEGSLRRRRVESLKMFTLPSIQIRKIPQREEI